MRRSFFLKTLIFFALIFSFLFIANHSLATSCACTTGPCCDGCNYKPDTDVCDTQYATDYNCPDGTACGQDVKVKYKQRYCPGDGPDCTGTIDATWGSWSLADDCEAWEICTPGNSTCNSIGTSSNPTPADGAVNVKLPVTLSWYAVSKAKSYRYKIVGVLENYTTNTTIKIDETGTCLLASNTTYQWGVKACCDANGNNCGNWTSWGFTTSLAPQVLSPLDNATNVSIPVFLDWCDVANVQSWLLRIYLIEDGSEVCHPWLILDGSCSAELIKKEERPPPSVGSTLYSEYRDDKKGFFTKDTEYRWEIASCLREDGINCNDFSQKWGFKTTTSSLPVFNLLSPPDDPSGNKAVGLPTTLDWEDKPGINSFNYEVDGKTGTTSASQVSFNYPQLSLDTLYTWKVWPCWDYSGQKCESVFAGPWKFKTTGAIPNLLSPASDATNIIIPVKFDWQDVSGAGSYRYEIATDSVFTNIVIPDPQRVVENSEVLVNYPPLKMLTPYWWQVKTCAVKTGNNCGNWSSARKFTTFILDTPTNPSPQNGWPLFTYEKYISWDPVLGAKFYQYKIDYGGAEKIPPTIVSTNSVFLPTEQLELGNYSWYVQACLDKDCNAPGGLSSWSFALVQPTPPAKFGLVPCGRESDSPNTPWNEREICQFKHIFILFKNILDLLLWRIGLIILVLLAVATGVIYYFSMGAPTTMAKVKSILKSAGTGYAIIFLAWIIINLILIILGYKVGILGKWWEIKF